MSEIRPIMPSTTPAGESSDARFGMPAEEPKCLETEADRFSFGPLPEDLPNRNMR
ncbi:consensus disorder prediction [Desulfoluna spongiiphila]|nr:consensus disorder prediction [Desulfoluna spongiiphila]